MQSAQFYWTHLEKRMAAQTEGKPGHNNLNNKPDYFRDCMVTGVTQAPSSGYPGERGRQESWRHLTLRDKAHFCLLSINEEKEESLFLTHIASFALLPSTVMVFTLKSTPRKWEASKSLMLSRLPHLTAVPLLQYLKGFESDCKEHNVIVTDWNYQANGQNTHIATFTFSQHRHKDNMQTPIMGQLGIDPKSFLLWDDRAIHCTAIFFENHYALNKSNYFATVIVHSIMVIFPSLSPNAHPADVLASQISVLSPKLDFDFNTIRRIFLSFKIFYR